MAVKLSDYQLKAIYELKNGSILCGGVGTGKSRTGLGYYMFCVCEGSVKVNGSGGIEEMKHPRDLYIITTAKKRDSKEWQKECAAYLLFEDRENSLSGVKVTVDSWNNIKKYKDVYGAFFLFDEQRLVGSGTWVKTFLNIARKNQWILLTATPGDQWSDYIPVFVANGFFKNKTDFNRQHCIFSPYTKFPKIERYVGEKRLQQFRSMIVVEMDDQRHTIRHDIYVVTDYDTQLYRTVIRDRWDPYDECPIEETGKLMYLLRKVVNSDESRIRALDEILGDKKYLIVFYNFDYELEMIKDYLDSIMYTYSEWNGHKHQEIPKNPEGWVYLVQYAAGAEAWNCITTDTIVFYSQNYSYRTLEQARGRIDRMNTPFRDLYYYHFRSKAYIDIAIWTKLKDKKNFNESSFIRKRRTV